ncbi:MAG: isoprenylcysteine carboxylmethyltransferase family protein [Candidatus Korarchaeota archaeon]|nr:isoprenylcysteine carboxylmethyltransferase family protein [Candidatus Korarchaeota archaeon]
MFRELTLMMLTMWPSIPLFLIQLHLAPNFWRRLGVWTYLVVFLEWLPVAYAISLWQEEILQHTVLTTTPILVLGITLVTAGFVLHAWTAKLLGIKATIGYAELKPQNDGYSLITSGPFSVVRHPSYVAHTLIFVGILMITGVIAVGITALADFLIAYFITIELEERELIQRFGNRYREYQMRVPKFFLKLAPRAEELKEA